MKRKKIKQITVETHPNGYSLRFDGMSAVQGYMYLTLDKLLEGFMLHIGLGMTDQLDQETMQDFILAACNWNENEACVGEIKRLNNVLKRTTQKRDTIAKKLINERRKLLYLVNGMNVIAGKASPEVKNKIKDITKSFVKTRPITLKELGITSDMILDDENNDNEV